jgi:NADPH:quinone reductase-like Zn-dependent oxidoreductase
VEGAVKKDPARFRTDMAALVERLSSGAITPEVTTLPLTQAAEAHRLLESRQVTGKIVLLP